MLICGDSFKASTVFGEDYLFLNDKRNDSFNNKYQHGSFISNDFN